MNKKQRILFSIKPWQWLLLSVVFSEILTSLMALILTGRVPPDYLITGFIVSLVVASVVVYILNQARAIEARAKELLEEANNSLEEKVDARTSDLILANEKLREEISERKNAQETIKDSEKRYRDLFNSISDLVMIHDLKGRLLNVNPAVSKLCGYTGNEMVGRPISDFVAPKFRSRFQDEYLRRIKKQTQLEGVAVFQAKDGTERYIEFRNTLTCRAGAEPYISGSGRDITEQMKSKKALEKAKQDAEAANQAKSEFLANMSHELRTPLNHIIGFTEIILDKNFGELNATQEEYLNDVWISSRHLLSLINDILDLSKVEAGKLELESSEVDLRILLENSLIMVKEKALKKGISLSIEINGIPETIKADERKLKQIQYNLLSNAVKFSSEGGQVEVNARIGGLGKDSDLGYPEFNIQHTNWIHISVADTGIGLSKEDLDRIFNPFEQVENSKSRKYQGTGLGLSLTKTLVGLHCGKMWAESEGEGKGSKFNYIIPNINAK